MRVDLSFTPVSQNPVDLLAFVLDGEKTLHDVDDPIVRAHLERAAAAFRSKTLKREYYVTLPEGAVARALVAYWSPQLPAWSLPENLKTFTARALRLARDYRLPRVGLVVNTRGRRRARGRGRRGRRDRHASLRQVQAGEGRLLPEARLADDPDPPREQGRRRGAPRALRLGGRERQPGARPRRRARQRGDARVRGGARERAGARGGPRVRGARRGGAARAGPARHRPGGRGQRERGPAGDAALPADEALPADGGPRRQGHHLRQRRHQPQAGRQDVGDEGRHGGSGGGALRHARARPPEARGQGGGHPVLRGEHAGRASAASGRHLRRQEREVGDGRQHRRGGPPRADGRLLPRRGGGRDAHGRRRHPDRRGRPRARAERRRHPGQRPRAGAPRDPLRREPRRGDLGAAARRGVQGVAQDALRRPQQPLGGGLAGAITAGLFLREFVPDGVGWAHLDIAGAGGFRDKEWKYFDAGSSGFGVRTLVDLCEGFHQAPP